MTKLLYIQASPRGERSFSVSVADAFVSSYRESHPGHEIETLNLFETALPEFDGYALEAKYAILHGQSPTDDQRAAWKAIEAVIDQFKSADKYVFAVPMWNFHLPYRLKHYIDILVQPTYTFSYSPDRGYTGLVTGRPVLVSYARGGSYPPGSESEGYDFQTKYFEAILGFIGLSDIRRLVVEPTLMDPEAAARAKQTAVARAKEMAKTF